MRMRPSGSRLVQTAGTHPSLQAQLSCACSTTPCPGRVSLKRTFPPSSRGTIASSRAVLSTNSPSVTHTFPLLLTAGSFRPSTCGSI